MVTEEEQAERLDHIRATVAAVADSVLDWWRQALESLRPVVDDVMDMFRRFGMGLAEANAEDWAIAARGVTEVDIRWIDPDFESFSVVVTLWNGRKIVGSVSEILAWANGRDGTGPPFDPKSC